MQNWFRKNRKICAVLRNYELHAKEMNSSVSQKPEFFLKPPTSLLPSVDPKNTLTGPSRIVIPKGCENNHVHHEVELGVVIQKGGKYISRESAMEHVGGYVLCLDITARNIQDEAKKSGKPWTLAKGFDTFCPFDAQNFLTPSQVKDPHNLEIWLKVDGVERQRGNTKDMIFRIPDLISYISSVMTLEENDLILTGTPQGVGPIVDGNTITCGITGHFSTEFFVQNEENLIYTPKGYISKL